MLYVKCCQVGTTMQSTPSKKQLLIFVYDAAKYSQGIVTTVDPYSVLHTDCQGSPCMLLGEPNRVTKSYAQALVATLVVLGAGGAAWRGAQQEYWGRFSAGVEVPQGVYYGGHCHNDLSTR